MRSFAFAYIGGILASIPAFTLFNNVGASPFHNFESVMQQIGGSLTSIAVYFLLLWLVPPVGAALGAKIGGRLAEFRYMFNRGISGQVAFTIGFGLLMVAVDPVGSSVLALPTTSQTVIFLMAGQLGCSLMASGF